MITLRKEHTAEDSRLLTAELNDDGDLVIMGLDSGKGVQKILGCIEYEWVWTVKAKYVPMFAQSLNTEGEILAVLNDNFKAEKAADLHAFMTQNQIPFGSWSRTGD